ncbi:MAG: hypothetical protein IKU25_05740 [Clostridia bacterium]|nr:hypothetical protein [Clostridia bacterium]
MGNVLYEVTFKFDFALLVPVVMMIFILFCPRMLMSQFEEKNIHISYKSVKIFCSCAFAFVFFIFSISIISHINMYKNVVGAYKTGDYEVVEGYVQNFIPMPYEGHAEESFEINGVKFAYSDYIIQSGYNNTKSHGGVIKGDGQYLKIGYVYYNDENIIVYIEQLK